MHRPGWCDVLLEGFFDSSSYVTLYDFDYFNEKGFLTEIFVTDSTHWRAVPATTNTFACKYKNLIEDLEIHKKYSSYDAIKEEDGFHFSKDYEKFWELQQQKKYVISPIPGWSTHCDFNHLSPILNWGEILSETYQSKNQKENISLKYK